MNNAQFFEFFMDNLWFFFCSSRLLCVRFDEVMSIKQIRIDKVNSTVRWNNNFYDQWISSFAIIYSVNSLSIEWMTQYQILILHRLNNSESIRVNRLNLIKSHVFCCVVTIYVLVCRFVLQWNVRSKQKAFYEGIIKSFPLFSQEK